MGASLIFVEHIPRRTNRKRRKPFGTSAAYRARRARVFPTAERTIKRPSLLFHTVIFARPVSIRPSAFRSSRGGFCPDVRASAVCVCADVAPGARAPIRLTAESRPRIGRVLDTSWLHSSP